MALAQFQSMCWQTARCAHQDADEKEHGAKFGGLVDDVEHAVRAPNLVLAQRSSDLVGAELAKRLACRLHGILNVHTQLHTILAFTSQRLRISPACMIELMQARHALSAAGGASASELNCVQGKLQVQHSAKHNEAYPRFCLALCCT